MTKLATVTDNATKNLIIAAEGLGIYGTFSHQTESGALMFSGVDGLGHRFDNAEILAEVVMEDLRAKEDIANA